MDTPNRGFSAIILLVIAAVIVGILYLGIDRVSKTPSSILSRQVGASGAVLPQDTENMTSTYNMKYGYEFQYSVDHNQDLLVYPIFASSDPKNFLTADETSLRETYSTTTINNLTWIRFNYASNTIGYYIYHEGEAVRIMEAAPFPSSLSAEDIALLDQVVFSFRFVNSTDRLDNQVAALKVGQQIGNISISNIIPESDEHGEVDFSGRLTLSGRILGSGGMFQASDEIASLDSMSLSQIPVVGCPCWYSRDEVQISLDTNDLDATIQQELNNAAENGVTTTIVVTNLKEQFVPDETGQFEESQLPILWSAHLVSIER